jgi:hypothetical protein
VGRGSTVPFTVVISLGRALNGVVIDDVFSGGGRSPDTDYVANSGLLDGGSLPSEPTLSENVLNRVVRTFQLGDLSAGPHTLTYRWKIGDQIGCFTDVANEAHLDAQGMQGHVDTDTIHFSVRCFTPTPTAGGPTSTPSATGSPMSTRTPTNTRTATATSTTTATPGAATSTLTPTGIPANVATIKKTGPSQIVTGDTVTFTVTITLGSARTNVVIHDAFTGAGRAPDTDYVAGSGSIDGGPILGANQTTNQLNRVEYDFSLGDLAAGGHTFTFAWRIATADRIGCFTNGANEAQMRAGGSSTLLSSSRTTFSIRCATGFAPSAPLNAAAPQTVAEPLNPILEGLSWLAQTLRQLFTG